MGNVEFVTVKVQIGNQTRTVKMEKGTQFQNKGGIFTADKNGATVKMTNYQMKVFEAVANNTQEQGMGKDIVLSAEDIKSAQQKFKQGGYVADMSEFLPDGYKIERPLISTKGKYIEAYVTNGKESQSATLRFAYGVTSNNNVNETNPTTNPSNTNNTVPKKPIALKGADQDKVNTYYQQFKTMTADEIANTIQKQINGLSSGTKTLSMFDAIPNDKLVEVYKSFSNKTDHEGAIARFFNSGHEHRSAWRHCPLLMQMYEEISISKDEVYERARRMASNLNIGFSKEQYDKNPKEALVYLENDIASKLNYIEPFSATWGGEYAGYQLTEQ